MRQKKKIISYLLVLVIIISLWGGIGPGTARDAYAEGVVQRDWYKYSTRSLYYHLTSEQKAFYKRMDSVCLGILNGTGSVHPYRGISEGISLEGLDVDSARLTLISFLYDNPQYYFAVNNTITTSYNTPTKKVYKDMYFVIPDELVDANERAAVTNQIFSTLDSYISQISGANDYEKMVSACQIICSNTDYYDIDSNELSTYQHQGIYSVMINKIGVCAGYSKTLSAMLNAIGIKNAMMRNEARNHVWLKVCLNGKWYNTDVLWADSSKKMSDKFIAKSDSNIKISDGYERAHSISAEYPFNPIADIDYNPAQPASGNTANIYQFRNEWVNGKWYDSNGNQSYSGTLEWKCNSTGWWVEDTSGWYPVNSWQMIDGFMYYFGSSGYMASSEWVNGCYLSSSGALEYAGRGGWNGDSWGWWYEDTVGWYPQNQWLKIDESWYFFEPNGYIATDRYVDGYWVGSDGVCW